jgi:hypothetical protein
MQPGTLLSHSFREEFPPAERAAATMAKETSIVSDQPRAGIVRDPPRKDDIGNLMPVPSRTSGRPDRNVCVTAGRPSARICVVVGLPSPKLDNSADAAKTAARKRCIGS